MKTAKMLPWLARRAAVSDHRAKALWLSACGQAASETGEHDNAYYWGAAKENFLDLLEGQRQRTQPLPAGRLLLLREHLERCSALARPYLALLEVALATRAIAAHSGESR